MLILSLVFVLALVGEYVGWNKYADLELINTVIWICFVIEYILLLLVAEDKKLFFKKHILDLIIIILPALRLIRVLRAFRMLRLLRLSVIIPLITQKLRVLRKLITQYGFGVIIITLVVILVISSTLMCMIEGAKNTNFASFGTSLWWTFVTLSTIGYGDSVPTTCGGRIVAVCLILSGTIFFTTILAKLTQFLVENKEENILLNEIRDLSAKVDRLEKMLNP